MSTEDQHDAIGNLFPGLMYGFEPFNKKRKIIVSKSRLHNMRRNRDGKQDKKKRNNKEASK